MLIAGKIFGIFWGALISFSGAFLAAAIGFYACRYGGHAVYQRLVGKEDMQRIDQWFGRYGLFAVIMSRPIPMMTEILSCLAGLTDVKPRYFLGAAALGTYPVCLIYAYVGDKGALSDPLPLLLVALIIPGLGWLLTRSLQRPIEKEDSPHQSDD